MFRIRRFRVIHTANLAANLAAAITGGVEIQLLAGERASACTDLPPSAHTDPIR